MALPRLVTATLAATLAATTLLAATPRAEARCAATPVGPVVLAPRTPGAPRSGVVVATHAFRSSDDDTAPLRLRVRGKLVAAAPRALAPGLAVFELPAGATRAELLQGKRVVSTLAASKRAPAALAAPVAAAITVLTSPPPRPAEPNERGRRERTTVILDAPAPAGAIALIMYDEQGTAVTFAAVSPGTTGALAIYEAYRCEIHPPGHRGLHAGAKATLAWVDATGQVGARSTPLTLAGVARTE